MPIAFISVVLLPIVGNAAEHAGAIMFAMKDKLVRNSFIFIFAPFQMCFFLVSIFILFFSLNIHFFAGYITGSGNRFINTDIYVWGRYYTLYGLYF